MRRALQTKPACFDPRTSDLNMTLPEGARVAEGASAEGAIVR